MSRKNIERAQQAFGADYGKRPAREPSPRAERPSPAPEDRETFEALAAMKDRQGQDSFARALAANQKPGSRRSISATQLHDLAQALPLTRKQKQYASENGLAAYRTRKTRGDNIQVEARPDAVERFVEQVNPGSPQELVMAVAGSAGYRYDEIGRIGRRVARSLAAGRRLPSHIRDKAILLSAMAQGVKIAFPAAYAAGLGMGDSAQPA